MSSSVLAQRSRNTGSNPWLSGKLQNPCWNLSKVAHLPQCFLVQADKLNSSCSFNATTKHLLPLCSFYKALYLWNPFIEIYASVECGAWPPLQIWCSDSEQSSLKFSAFLFYLFSGVPRSFTCNVFAKSCWKQVTQTEKSLDIKTKLLHLQREDPNLCIQALSSSYSSAYPQDAHLLQHVPV